VATIDSTRQPCPVTSLVQRGSVEQGVERATFAWAHARACRYRRSADRDLGAEVVHCGTIGVAVVHGQLLADHGGLGFLAHQAAAR
jgi:hypothetical protein